MKGIQTRMTKQRKVILEELRKVTSHPTAEELYTMVRERIPHVSLGTVYRNLDFLSASGEIQQINSGGATRRFDGNNRPHCHVRCLSCGRLGDIHLDIIPTDPLPDIQHDVEGFAITGSRIEFDGYCRSCRPHAEPVRHMPEVVIPASAAPTFNQGEVA